ncbi:MAG: HTH domain-containing protein [Hyphomicrobiaceae bacterium]
MATWELLRPCVAPTASSRSFKHLRSASRPLSARELAARQEVTPRTIYRDSRVSNSHMKHGIQIGLPKSFRHLK